MTRWQMGLLLGATALFGMLAGALFLPARDAQAQAQPVYRECFAATTWTEDGAHLTERGFRPRTIAIPGGWTPVGAGASQRSSFVTLCR